MAHFSFMRWIRGLMPTVVMLLLAVCFFCVCYLAIFGLPQVAIEKVEAELAAQGVPVRIGALKISFWPRAVLSFRDLSYQPTDEKGNSLGEFGIDKLNLALKWKPLLEAKVVPEHISVEALSIKLPAEKSDRTISLTQGVAQLDFSYPGHVNILQASANLQGIELDAIGNVSYDVVATDASSGFDLQATLKDLRKNVALALPYIDKLKWDKAHAPRLILKISDDSSDSGMLVDVDFQAPNINFETLSIQNLVFSGSYVDGLITANKFSLQDAVSLGTVNLSCQADLKNHKIFWDVRSTAPVISWTVGLLNKSLVPRELQFHSEPYVTLNGYVHFDDKWEQTKDLKIIGYGSVGEFSLFGEKFAHANGNVSYHNGDFYVSDLDVRHRQGHFVGNFMRRDGKLHIDVQSSLPIPALYNMQQSVAPDLFKMPNNLDIKGIPELKISGTAQMPEHKDTNQITTERVVVMLNLDDLAWNGVAFDSLNCRVDLIGESINLSQFLLKQKSNSLKLEGNYLGTDAVFTVESDLNPHHICELLRDVVEIPKELKLPQLLTTRVHGRLDLSKPGECSPSLLHVTLKAQDFAWNEVPIFQIETELDYYNGTLFVQDCHVEAQGGMFELFAHGDLHGEIAMMGQSTLPLTTIDKLINTEDDNFFMQRFELNDNSVMHLTYSGVLGTYHLEKAYDFNMSLDLANMKYKGVNVKHAHADAQLVTNRLKMENVVLTVDNKEYFSEAKLGGPKECTLKAGTIDFDFTKNTVEVLKLDGKAYPGYTIRMFSGAATRVLKDFTFTRPAVLTGGGLFPMGDDFRLMKGRIRFDASAGNVRYKLLGTTLDLTKAKGTVLISPDWVVVDKFTGQLWKGSFDGRVSAQIDEGNDLNASFVLQDMDLADIGKSYNVEMNPATVHGAIDLRSDGGRVNTIQAKGEVALVNGNLVEVPLFGFFGSALADYIPGLSHLINYNINRADCDFSIRKGYVTTSNFQAKGSNLSLEGGGWVRISDMEVDSGFKLSLRGLPAVLTYPVFLLAGGSFQVSGKGPLENVQWSFEPFSRTYIPTPPTGKQNK